MEAKLDPDRHRIGNQGREAERRLMRKLTQRALYCRCGREAIVARGLCGTCYTLKRQDQLYFGGLREQVLERDGYCCRGCGRAARGKRSIVVHHRRPGTSVLKFMLALCPACHARIHRTVVARFQQSRILLTLWREQHPRGHEQMALAL